MLMQDKVPGTGNKKQLQASFGKVRALKEQLPNLVILPSHDPAAAKALADDPPHRYPADIDTEDSAEFHPA